MDMWPCASCAAPFTRADRLVHCGRICAQNHAFQIRLETWGSSTEAGIRGALQGIDSALRTTVNNLGNTGRDNSAPSWRGTAADPVDIILRRSMGAGNNDDYFPDVRPGPRGGLAPHTRAQSVSLSVGAFRVQAW